MFCPKCGSQVQETDKFCKNCGQTLVQVPKPKPKKDHVTAGVLAICLGGIGVHRFYLGDWIGLLYLAFCWTGIPAIIGAIEGIIWLTNPDRFYERYGNTNQG
ncbi:MAG: NINE protein [Candidatus Methanomethylicaceae archaeon]